MKKWIACLAAVMTLFAAVSLAEDLPSLTDEELTGLYQQVQAEMERRGLIPAGPEADSETEKEKTAAAKRLTEFFSYWSVNDLDNMLALSAPSWQEHMENPRTALFGKLLNRTPMSMTMDSIAGDPAAGTVRVTLTSLINRNNGKDPLWYRMELVMVKENGVWYLDPRSLVNEECMGVTPDTTPEPAPTPEGLTDGTLLYYVPGGGEYYHLDPNCRRVNGRFLPLEDSFTWAEVNDEAYCGLQPCQVCGAPKR